jgi:hypothetical protein
MAGTFKLSSSRAGKMPLFLDSFMILLPRTFFQSARHHIPARRNNATIPGTDHSLNFKKEIDSCPGAVLKNCEKSAAFYHFACFAFFSPGDFGRFGRPAWI